MREIKFRAWIRSGQWDEDGEKRNFEMIDADSLSFEECEPLAILLRDIEDEQYLMQFTGLRDQTRTKLHPKGKEVYEGDIIQYDHEDGIAVAQVIFEESEDEDMWISGFKYQFLYIIESEKKDEEVHFKVLGNIYENPELLKQ